MRARAISDSLVTLAVIVLSALALAVAATSSPAQEPPGLFESAADVKEVRPLKAFFTGTISTMSDAGWTIETSAGDVVFSLRENTRIDRELGRAEIGATVRVLAHVMPDGTSVALVVSVKDS